MSFYFGHPATSDTRKTVSTYVQNLGLDLIKASPNTITAVVVPASAQPGYASYVANLPYFMHATALGRNVPITASCIPYRRPDRRHLLPWALPPLIYDYTVKLNDAYIRELHVHSESVTQAKSKNPTFVLQSPTPEVVKRITDNQSFPPQTRTRHVRNTVNLDALKVARSLIDITSSLISTHNYPAFKTIEDLQPVEAAIVPYSPLKKKRRINDTYLECVRDINATVEDLSELDKTMLQANSTVEGIPLIRLHTARPSDTSTPNWGTLAHIPNMDGMFVPYVKELCNADASTVPDFIIHHLAKALGPNIATVMVQIQVLKTGWGLIQNVDLGHEMSHLYKCLEIAIRGQASVYPVFTNRIYEGCVICGSGFMVGLYEQVYRPIPFADLQDMVRDKSMHSQAVTRIKSLLGDMVDDEIDAVGSIRELSKLVVERGVSVEDRQNIVSWAHKLCYENVYWSSNATNSIIDALKMLQSGDDIPDNVPMYPTALFTDDRVESVLSAFGWKAPTFLIPNGTTMKIGGRDNVAPRNLFARSVELNRAVTDMKYVMENLTVTNNNNNLSQKHKDKAFHGKAKEDVWTQLGKFRTEDDDAKTAATSKPGQPEGNVEKGAFEWDW